MRNIFKVSKITIFVIFFLCGFIIEASADIIYLKNGRSLKGLVKSEDEKNVELDLGFGTVKLTQAEIESIERSSPQEALLIRQEWQKYKESVASPGQKKEPESKEIGFSRKRKDIIVNALLNKKVRAALVLDTGSSTVALSQRIANELGLETAQLKEGAVTQFTMADGREVEGRIIVLDSIEVEGLEEKNVLASILLKEGNVKEDGLLGNSFLSRFNFQVDSLNKKLVLKRLTPEDILERTQDFNVTYPSDWEKSLNEEGLIIFGPLLPAGETELSRPNIIIKKDVDEPALAFAKETREWHNRWKEAPEVKDKLLASLEEGFRKSYPQADFISSDFREKQDTIIVSVAYFFKQYNRKIYNVKVIKKDGPLQSYSLVFSCIGKYFDEYLPVFNRCLESFSINR